MNEIEIFNNPDFGEIRTLETENGKVLFCGKDVAAALDYKDTRHAITAHCKGGVKCPLPTNGGVQEMTFIPESDVYRLAFGSKLPTAERFTDWVTDEVLPAIRKTGSYSKTDSYLIADPIERAKRWIEEQQKVKQLETTVAVQSQQIAELTPKAGYYDVILACKDAISTTVIAKDYGKSAKWMNQKLHELGIQYKQRDIWLLYQTYAEQGYTCTRTTTYTKTNGTQGSSIHTYWTQKGRIFLYDTLKKHGILPVIEQKGRSNKEADEDDRNTDTG